jgi:hypothetical protein
LIIGHNSASIRKVRRILLIERFGRTDTPKEIAAVQFGAGWEAAGRAPGFPIFDSREFFEKNSNSE